VTAEEERWIEIILEEGRKADEAERTPSSSESGSSQWDGSSRSSRNGQPIRVRAEHLIERPGQQYAAVI
jgi:hypothetical protein